LTSRPPPAIVLVDFNGLDDTRRCLESLAPAASGGGARVLVVDNASKVDVSAALAADFPWATFVRADANGGWAGGNNLGLTHALADGADLVVLLNNDTVVGPDFVERMVAAADAHPDFGVLGPVIRFLAPPHEVQTDGVRFNAPGTPGFFQRLPVPVAADPTPGTRSAGGVPAVTEVDIVNGCCLMVRRAVVERIGPIDEAYFLIHEESDYCLRAQEAGFKNGVVAEALVWHKGSSSFQREGKKLQRYFDARNLVRLLRRHGRRAGGRGAWASRVHGLRYAYHRYAHEREGGFAASAEAVLEGLYDAARHQWGPYRDRPRLGLGVVRVAVAALWHVAGDRPRSRERLAWPTPDPTATGGT
jgi:GT2 family glycosyltransferase